MGSYLDRLKAMDAEKCLPMALPKLPKAPFDSKDGSAGGQFSENSGDLPAYESFVATAFAKPEPPTFGERMAARAEADRLMREAAYAFHGHLFGPGVSENCCYARAGRYCAEGARLRAEYRRRAAEIRGGKNGWKPETAATIRGVMPTVGLPPATRASRVGAATGPLWPLRRCCKARQSG